MYHNPLRVLITEYYVLSWAFPKAHVTQKLYRSYLVDVGWSEEAIAAVRSPWQLCATLASLSTSFVCRYREYRVTDSCSQDGCWKREKARRFQLHHPFASHVRLSWGAEVQAWSGLQNLRWQVDERKSSTARLSFGGRVCAEQQASCARGNGANGRTDLLRCGHQWHGARS